MMRLPPDNHQTKITNEADRQVLAEFYDAFYRNESLDWASLVYRHPITLAAKTLEIHCKQGGLPVMHMQILKQFCKERGVADFIVIPQDPDVAVSADVETRTRAITAQEISEINFA